MKAKRFAPIVLAATVLFFLSAACSGRQLEIFSVCELKTLGPQLDGKHIRLRAEFMTDLNHFAFFMDRHCPDAIVAEDEVIDSDKDPSVKEFDRALWSHAPFASTLFTVDVSGRFVWEKNWQPPLNLSAGLKPGPRGLLVVEKVWNFRRMQGDMEQ